MRWPTTQLIGLTVAGLAAVVAVLPARERPPVSAPQAAAIGGLSLAPTARLPDPFPIRRVFLADERFDPPTKGGLRKLSHEEFEARVREAAAAQAAARTPPALARATYQATYSPGQLSGKLMWTFVSPSGVAGVASLDSIKVAVGPSTWADGNEAVLFRGKLARRALPGLYLWVGSTGGDLSAEWSTRGSEEPEHERFELSVPTAAVSTLDLTVPADRVLGCGTAGVLLTGPFPTATPTERLWKLTFGGVSNMVLTVRRVAPTTGPGTPIGRVARYELTSSEVRATFEFPNGSNPAAEQAFDIDPGLQVTGVRGRPADRWRYEPGGTPMSPGRLRVFGMGIDPTLAVTAAIPFPAGSRAFDFPAVRPSDGSIGSDTFDVSLHPDLTLAGWESGDYRATVSGQHPDRSFRLQFTGTFVTSSGERRKPVVRVQPADVAYTTDEALEWVVSPGRARLTAKLKVKAVRGPLAVVTVGCEPGYWLEAVTLTPDDTAVAFSPQPEVPGGWWIEPTRAIPTGQTVEFRLDFHGPAAIRAADPADLTPTAVPLAFPTFSTAAIDRTGVLNVSGRGMRATARTSATTEPLGPGEFAVHFRGRLPTGEARFTPERAAATLTGVNVALHGSTTTITLSGTGNDIPIGSLTLFTLADATEVRVPGATVRKLPMLELFPLLAGPGWGTVGAAAANRVTMGSHWQIQFPRPLQGEFSVTVVSPAWADTEGKPLAIPMPTLCGVNAAGAKVTLSPELSTVYRVPEAGHVVAGLQTFPAHLVLTPKVAADATSRGWAFADLRVTSTVSTDRTSVMFDGRVSEAAGPTLPIRLPVGATFETAEVGHKWVEVRLTADGVELPLPELPSGGLTFEVRYQLPKPSGWLIPQNRSTPPELPTSVTVTSRWAFADGQLPWPSLDPASASGTAVRTVPLALVWAVGLLAAGVVLGVSVWATSRGQRSVTVTLAVVLIGAGCVGWLTAGGWWVLVRPSLVAGFGVWAVAAAVRTRQQVIPSVTAVLVAVLISPLSAQPEEPQTVYIVTDGDRLAVYTPPLVLDSLAELTASPLPPVALTRADYTGVVANGVTKFDATFSAVCTRDGTHALALPLTGVQLERATVDGAEAFPDAVKPDRYTIPFTGKGRHELTLRFTVLPIVTGSAREVRFTGPEVPVCRVRFDTTANSPTPDVVTRRGGQASRTTDGKMTTTADHGGGGVIAVRWRDGAGAGAGGTVASAREAAVWDVSETDPAVTAAVIFHIRDGLIDQLTVDLPTGLRATRISAGGVGVKNWTVGAEANGWSPIDVRLTQPTDGAVTVVVRAVPVQPLTTTPILRFPRAGGLTLADRNSIYGVRFIGSQATGMSLPGAIDYPPDALVKDFPTVPEFGFDRLPPSRVVRRTETAESELRPVLAPLTGMTTAGSEVIYTVGRWVEVEGAVRATGKEVGHLEFDLPKSCEVRDVRATGLAGWNRAGSRVRVWLTQPVTNLTVRWSGSVNRTGDTFALPLPQWPKGATPTEPLTVRVKPSVGWAVAPHQITGMQPRPAETPSELVFTAEPTASAVVTVTSIPTVPSRPIDPVTKPTLSPANEPSMKPTEAVATPVDDSASPSRWYWLRVTGWLLGLLVTLAVWAWDGSRWWPECLFGMGLLAAVMFGPSNPIGWVFVLVALAGVGCRMTRVIRGRVAV